MRRALAILVLLILAVVAFIVWRRDGWSARAEPSRVEAFIAGQVRHLAMPRDARRLQNPVPESPAVLESGRRHFADHCASCHANDGSGRTELARGLYPKVPDMRRSGTQSLADGELFFIIANGVRFTGMPAWGDGSDESKRQSWELVRFIRHLPRLTAEELRDMERFNAVSPMEQEEREAERRFLEGGAAPGPENPHHEPN